MFFKKNTKKATDGKEKQKLERIKEKRKTNRNQFIMGPDLISPLIKK